ncbi:MAG: entericidin [bacterium]
MKSLIPIAFTAIIALLFTGCNTISGAGRDVSATGRGVSSGANAVKNSMQN